MGKEYALPERLKITLAKSGVKQAELAEILEVSSSAISSLVSGRSSMSARQLFFASERLGVSADYLLGLSDGTLTPYEPNSKVKFEANESRVTYERLGAEEVGRLKAENEFLKEQLRTAQLLYENAQKTIRDKEYIIQMFERDHSADRKRHE